MAPIPSSTGTVRSSTDATFDASGTAVTFSFDAGTDADRFLLISVSWDGASGHTLGDSAVTYNSVALTALGATTSQSSARKRTYGLIAPATGSNTVSVDPSGGIGSEDAIIEVYCYSGVDQTTPYDGYATANATDGSAPYESAVTVTSATGDLVWVSHMVRAGSVTGGTSTGFTERLDNVASNIGAVSGDQTGAASVVTSVAWAGVVSIDYIAHGANLNAIITGPTINTQPTAATVRLNGDPTTAATFTVSATTSGGALSYQWQLEDSVGGGTYTNLSNTTASGITWSGVTTASATATCTATTQSGKRVRCNVTDSNGTTTSTAVALTILTGPVLSAYSGTTNGSGVVSVNLTSDDALTTNGEVLRITATCGGITKRVYVRPT